MKKIFWIIVFMLTPVLTACGVTSTPTPIPTVSLDDNASGTGSTGLPIGDTVIASAEVRPANSVELSFPQLGTVKTVEVEVADTVTAGQTLATLETTILEARIAEAEANVLAAETQVRYLRRVGVGNAYERIEAAQAEVARAQAVVDQLKAQLAQTILTSPISGTVITVDVAPGETANPGQAIFVIADLSNMRIETTDLSERDIPVVRTGQTASVYIDALEETFAGKVVDIDRQSETIGGDVTYRVTVELDQQPVGLRWGMSSEVEILTE